MPVYLETQTELAKIMELYMNKGELNGIRLLDSNVVNDFTSRHFCPKTAGGCVLKTRNGSQKESPVTQECSAESFVTAVSPALLPGRS